MTTPTSNDLLAPDGSGNPEGHSPDFRRDRWGHPLIVPPDGGKAKPYTRASAAAKTVDDTYNLELWARRNVAWGISHDRSLVARVLAVGATPKEWTRDERAAVNKIVEDAQQVARSHEAADIGTAVHHLTDRLDRGEIVAGGPYTDDLAAYRQTLTAAGIVVHEHWIECRLVCDDLKMAGTADRLVTLHPDSDLVHRLRVAPGEAVVADLKTGASVAFGGLGWAAQLAAYANSVLYDTHTEQRQATPPINQRWGLIIHLPAGQGRCELYTVDLTAGLAAAHLANTIRAIRKAAKGWLSHVTPTETVTSTAAVTKTTGELPVERARSELRARLNAAVTAGARDIAWPGDIPRFADGGPTTWTQVRRVEQVVLDAEAEAGMPFAERLPAEPPSPEPVPSVEPLPTPTPPVPSLREAVTHITPDAPRARLAPSPRIPPRPPTLTISTPQLPKLDPADLTDIRAAYDTLPADLQNVATKAVVSAGRPVDHRLWLADDSDTLHRIMFDATMRHDERKAQIAAALGNWANDPLLGVVLRDAVRDDLASAGPADLDLLTHTETQRLTATVQALDHGVVAIVGDDDQACLACNKTSEPALLEAYGSKGAILVAARPVAALHKRPKPTSAATVATDPVLTALLWSTARNTAG